MTRSPDRSPGRIIKPLAGGLVLALSVGFCLDNVVNDSRVTVSTVQFFKGIGGDNGSAQAPDPYRSASQAPAVNTEDMATYQASFKELADKLGGEIGLAWAPVGRGGEVRQLGTLEDGPAWSTIKVPISIAVEESDDARRQAGISAAMKRAITASDNEAAKRLWASLGSPEEAARSTGEVLREAGDTETVVRHEVTRPEFSAYGQTNWSLENQTAFVSGLSCIPAAKPVLQLMSEVIEDQSWGAGTIDGARFKSGWGPDPEGAYMARQMAIVTLDNDTQIGISIAAAPQDGEFETATRNVTAIAKWVVENIHTTEKAQC